MQTFLPYSDFTKSAETLDKKRCWKQVVEAKQIIDVLELKQKVQIATYGYASIDKTIPWSNHPAVKMWVGYTNTLKHYFNIFLEVCIEKHNINTKYIYLESTFSWPNNENCTDLWVDRYQPYYNLPWWLGNEDFHRAMRARLIEKDREFYLPLF